MLLKKLVFILSVLSILGTSSAQNKFTIVIHGGAGAFSKDSPDSIKQIYYKSLNEALSIGKSVLQNGGTSLQAVERVINYMEDNPVFNAGRGAVYTAEGKHELDASIMLGKDLSAGAVAGVTIIKNPISLARLVMEKTEHVLLSGKGAEEFGKKMGVKIVENSYFDTDKRAKQQEKESKDKDKGTVGCVAIDKDGNITAGTSTGGRSNKLYGRIGDSPIIGAGNYANNKTCGVSGTGIGELFIKHSAAFHVSALMEYKNLSLQEAVSEVVHNILPKDAGGLIAVDKDGNYAMEFSTLCMFRGAADSNGLFEVKIWNEE